VARVWRRGAERDGDSESSVETSEEDYEVWPQMDDLNSLCARGQGRPEPSAFTTMAEAEHGMEKKSARWLSTQGHHCISEVRSCEQSGWGHTVMNANCSLVGKDWGSAAGTK
jgi:hypothetical protein